MTLYYIYCLERDNVPFYIGVTKSIKNRIGCHKSGFGNFDHFILHEFYLDCRFSNSHKNRETKRFWEMHYVWVFKSFGFSLLNKRIGEKTGMPKHKRKRMNSLKAIYHIVNNVEYINIIIDDKPFTSIDAINYISKKELCCWMVSNYNEDNTILIEKN